MYRFSDVTPTAKHPGTIVHEELERRFMRDPNADPWCDRCGHQESDHPRGGRCGAATEEGCDCPRFKEPTTRDSP